MTNIQEATQQVERAEELLKDVRRKLEEIQNEENKELFTIQEILGDYSWYRVIDIYYGNIDREPYNKEFITVRFDPTCQSQINWNGVADRIHGLGFYIRHLGYVYGRDRLSVIVLIRYK